MDVKLSTGGIQALVNGEILNNPIFQILGAKKIAGSGGEHRFRLFISDGIHASPFAMLATQLNYMVEDESLEKFTVIRLDRFTCNLISQKRLMVITELTVIKSGSEIGEKIGSPQSIDSTPNTQTTTTRPQSPPNSNASYSGNRNSSVVERNQNVFQARGGLGGGSTENFPRSNGGSNRVVQQISNLNPYQNRWTIRARVTNKAAIRTWSNSRGEGKLFSMDLLDESGEIRATAFNKECDKFFDIIALNKLYYISQATLKTANKNFTSIKNDYEMTFNGETVVEPCHDQTDEIPLVQMNFVVISDLINHDKDTMVDVIGVCRKFGEAQTLVAKATNREFKKRDVTLVDKSNTEVNLTLWGEQADNFDGEGCPIIAVKGARVSDFGGRSLSMVSSGSMLRNPNIPEAASLRVWYDREGSSKHAETLTKQGGYETFWKYLSQVKSENLGASDRPDYFLCKVGIMMVKSDNCLYQACPSADCNKKVIDQNNDRFRCEKCNKDYPNFKWRLMLQMNIADYTDSVWTTAFQEQAEILLGITSEELGDLRSSDPKKFSKFLQDQHHQQHVLKLRAKTESYNDELRLKLSVVSVTPLDVVAYNKKLIEELNTY